MTQKPVPGETNDETPVDASRRRRRSIAIAVVLIVMVGLFYAATIIRMGANVLNRPL